MRTLIIGFGNPLRSDDAFGWRAVERLGSLAKSDSIRLLVEHQLAPEMAEAVSEAELVIFVDASHQGEPGTWKCEEMAADFTLVSPLAHQFTPAGLLAYTQTIFGAPPRALIISFAALSLNYGQTLTPRAEAAVADVLEWIRQEVF
jgi:hydrogenase maturation protease